MVKMSNKPPVRSEQLRTANLVWRLILISLVAALVVTAHLVSGLDSSVVENGIRNALHVVGFAAFAAIVY